MNLANILKACKDQDYTTTTPKTLEQKANEIWERVYQRFVFEGCPATYATEKANEARTTFLVNHPTKPTDIKLSPVSPEDLRGIPIDENKPLTEKPTP